MTLPSTADIFDAIEHTWPAATQQTVCNWTIRDGQGGGKRVSAATSDIGEPCDIAAAETAMGHLNQDRLFMIREDEYALDNQLAQAGYRIIDPVKLYACPIETLTQEPVPPMTAFAIWPPLAIAKELWAEGGIDVARIAVMERAGLPKTSILARIKDRAAGSGFVSIHRDIAMIHAIEVTSTLRRNGVAINIMRAAAHWAQDKGARYFSLAVTDANIAANALYYKLGMTAVGHYHYRIK
ncbi:MAG: GNAT family N-acetyltransferase [Marinosulfonomonas sp.]|nr:MAG: GNAT family N-acetyltransferase [Marinosulfonomonas sp.]